MVSNYALTVGRGIIYYNKTTKSVLVEEVRRTKI